MKVCKAECSISGKKVRLVFDRTHFAPLCQRRTFFPDWWISEVTDRKILCLLRKVPSLQTLMADATIHLIRPVRWLLTYSRINCLYVPRKPFYIISLLLHVVIIDLWSFNYIRSGGGSGCQEHFHKMSSLATSCGVCTVRTVLPFTEIPTVIQEAS